MKLSATIPVTTVIPRGRLQRAAKEVARTRLELELVALRRGWWWEERAFAALWLCGLAVVGYGLKTVWPVL